MERPIQGGLWTQAKRQEVFGTKPSSTVYENYQRAHVVERTGRHCPKATGWRLNHENSDLVKELYPYSEDDGFEYTEDFDGKQEIDSKTVFYNFKFVVTDGGAQTRTLKEVYWFLKAQIEYIRSHPAGSTYFVNILDGDVASKHMPKFRRILPKTNNIYVGDSWGFWDWWAQQMENHTVG